MFFEPAVLAAAVSSYAAENHRAELERKADAELFAWELEFLPLMTEEARAEYTRKKERAEDIRRQERQHRELIAVEERKARAIESAGRERTPYGALALGFIFGESIGR